MNSVGIWKQQFEEESRLWLWLPGGPRLDHFCWSHRGSSALGRVFFPSWSRMDGYSLQSRKQRGASGGRNVIWKQRREAGRGGQCLQAQRWGAGAGLWAGGQHGLQRKPKTSNKNHSLLESHSGVLILSSWLLVTKWLSKFFSENRHKANSSKYDFSLKRANEKNSSVRSGMPLLQILDGSQSWKLLPVQGVTDPSFSPYLLQSEESMTRPPSSAKFPGCCGTKLPSEKHEVASGSWQLFYNKNFGVLELGGKCLSTSYHWQMTPCEMFSTALHA